MSRINFNALNPELQDRLLAINDLMLKILEPTVYIQCKLVNATRSVIAYIPSKFAKQGSKLSIYGEDGWEVVSVYQSSTTENPPNIRKLIKGHRKNTGDSLPKCCT